MRKYLEISYKKRGIVRLIILFLTYLSITNVNGQPNLISKVDTPKKRLKYIYGYTDRLLNSYGQINDSLSILVSKTECFYDSENRLSKIVYFFYGYNYSLFDKNSSDEQIIYTKIDSFYYRLDTVFIRTISDKHIGSIEKQTSISQKVSINYHEIFKSLPANGRVKYSYTDFYGAKGIVSIRTIRGNIKKLSFKSENDDKRTKVYYDSSGKIINYVCLSKYYKTNDKKESVKRKLRQIPIYDNDLDYRLRNHYFRFFDADGYVIKEWFDGMDTNSSSKIYVYEEGVGNYHNIFYCFDKLKYFEPIIY